MIRYGLYGGAFIVAALWGVDYASKRAPPVEFRPACAAGERSKCNALTVPGGVVRPYRVVDGIKTPVANQAMWDPKSVYWPYNQFLGFRCEGQTNEGFYGPEGAYFPASDIRTIRIPSDAEIAAGGLYEEPRPVVIPARIAQYPPGDWAWGPESRLWCLPWQRLRWLNIVVTGPRLPFRVEIAGAP